METNLQPIKQRLLSLDVFRGLTVAAMILVNNPGSWSHIYAPLRHAEWHGCTPTDLIFPFFLFIVGVSISYALGLKKEDRSSHNALIGAAFKRALILFALGLFGSLFPKIFTAPLETIASVRIPGVLQRIAVVFFITAIIFLKTNAKTQFRIFIILLAVYWAMMNFIPVPDLGYPNLEKETNLAAWIDRTVLTEAHLWKSSKTWDPEGILSTIPAIATCLFGVLAGTYLRKKEHSDSVKVSWLFSAGLLATVLGLLWNMQFPINKSLWTSSYVLYTGGLATLCLALCYWIIDVQAYSKWTKPFVVYGVNAITVFVLSGVIAKTLNAITFSSAAGDISLKQKLYEQLYLPYFSPINASLAWAISFILFWLIILWWMYQKKWIIKV